MDPIDFQPRNAFTNLVIPPTQNRIVYVEVHVPQNAVPGIYSGTLTVTYTDPTNVARSVGVGIDLEVLGFTLPSTSSLRTFYRLFNGGICRGHFGVDCSVAPQATSAALKRKYAVAMLDHRLSSDVVFEGPAPLPNNPTAFDWAAFDAAYAGFYNGTASGLLSGARLTSVQYPEFWTGPGSNPVDTVDLTTLESQARTQDFFAEWMSHFAVAAPEWRVRSFDYTADEPAVQAQFDQIADRAPLSTAEGLASFVPGEFQRMNNAGVVSLVTILPQIINHYTRDQAGLASRPGEEWMYQSCLSHGCVPQDRATADDWCTIPGWNSVEFSGWPQIVIDSKAIQNRAMPWRSYVRAVSGEMYYEIAGVAGGGRNPWITQAFHGGHGDGSLVYPGEPLGRGTPDSVIGPVPEAGRPAPTAIPIMSLRLKHLRDGMEDYEYLRILESLPGGGRAAAEAQAVRVFPADDRTDEASMTFLRQVRAEIANEIVRLGGN